MGTWTNKTGNGDATHSGHFKNNLHELLYTHSWVIDKIKNQNTHSAVKEYYARLGAIDKSTIKIPTQGPKLINTHDLLVTRRLKHRHSRTYSKSLTLEITYWNSLLRNS